MKKVAIYARVSSDRQAEEKTIDSQLASLREICKSCHIIGEYRDEGWSGETLARPGLDKLRDDAAKGLFEAVYIHAPDRLARKYAYQVIVLEELKKKGVSVHFLDKAVSDDPDDQLLLGVQGLIAEYEKAKILERTRRGRLYKARYRGIVGGYAPYGYRYVKGGSDSEERYETHPAEAEVVRLIFRLYLELKSINGVRGELNRRGIRPQRSDRNWCRTSVSAILRNETYTGRGYYGRRQSVEREGGDRYRKKLKNGVRLRDRSEWIPINFPAIIMEDTFRSVQQVLRRNYRPYAQTRHFYLLSGLIRCSHCNSTFTGETRYNQQGRAYGYYRCNNRHKPNPRVDCSAPYIHIEEMDRAVWSAVISAIIRPEILVEHILRLAGGIEDGQNTLEQRRKQLTREIRSLEAQKGRLVELYTEGSIEKDLFEKKMASYIQGGETLHEELRGIDQRLGHAVSRSAVETNVKVFCQMACQRIRSFTPHGKRQFLWSLLDGIALDSWARRARVTGHIPIAENRGTGRAGRTCGTKDITSRSYVRCPENQALKFEIQVGI